MANCKLRVTLSARPAEGGVAGALQTPEYGISMLEEAWGGSRCLQTGADKYHV